MAQSRSFGAFCRLPAADAKLALFLKRSQLRELPGLPSGFPLKVIKEVQRKPFRRPFKGVERLFEGCMTFSLDDFPLVAPVAPQELVQSGDASQDLQSRLPPQFGSVPGVVVHLGRKEGTTSFEKPFVGIGLR